MSFFRHSGLERWQKKRRPARWPAFASFWDRARLEAVVHADLADVGSELDVGIEAARCRAAGCLAEIDVEIFDLRRPGAEEGVFDTGAGGPADLGLGFGRANRIGH